MPQLKIIDTLPNYIRQNLERRIIESRFRNYKEHKIWLNGQGIKISIKTVQQYGKELKIRREQLEKESRKLELSELEWEIVQKFRKSFDHQQEQVIQILFGTPQLSLLLRYYAISSHSGRQNIIEAARNAERVEFFSSR